MKRNKGTLSTRVSKTARNHSMKKTMILMTTATILCGSATGCKVPGFLAKRLAQKAEITSGDFEMVVVTSAPLSDSAYNTCESGECEYIENTNIEGYLGENLDLFAEMDPDLCQDCSFYCYFDDNYDLMAMSNWDDSISIYGIAPGDDLTTAMATLLVDDWETTGMYVWAKDDDTAITYTTFVMEKDGKECAITYNQDEDDNIKRIELLDQKLIDDYMGDTDIKRDTAYARFHKML